MMKKLLAIACGLVFVLEARSAGEEVKDAFHFNRLLGRGMNLGNALEAPTEGDWGITLQADNFKKIKDAGFQSVRIPIRWSAHAEKKRLMPSTPNSSRAWIGPSSKLCRAAWWPSSTLTITTKSFKTRKSTRPD